MINFLKEAVSRFKAPTPEFFKKLIQFGISVTGLGVGLLGIPNLPSKISVLAGYLVTAGAVIGLIAKFAVQNTTDSNQTTQP